MNSSPAIDRKRLERYPLAMNPLLYLMFVIPIFGFQIFSHFLLSPYQAMIFESEQSGVGTPTIYEWVFARPWLALALGVLHGLVSVWLLRLIQKYDPPVDVGTYFLSKTTRLSVDRTRAMRRIPFQIVGCLVTSFLALAGICVLLGVHINIAFTSSVLILMVVSLPKPLARHNEILRRRRIALAWEGVDPADDRFTLGQKVVVGFLVVLCCAFLPACAWLAYTIETNPDFAEARAGALLGEGSQLSVDEANALERRLEESPADHDARLKLISFYWERYTEARRAKDDERIAAEMQRQIPHARYFIENLPGHMYTYPARSAMPFRIDDADYSAISDLWREQLDRYPDDADVLWNAAWFFRRLNDEYYEELLERGRAMEPEEIRWASALARLQRRLAD